MSKKILEILADGFEEIEALAPCDFWRRCGFDVDIAALHGNSATGAHNISVKCDMDIAAVNIEDYHMIFLPGGMPGSLHLYNSPVVESMLKKMAEKQRCIAAICAAPMVLNKAGLLAGKRCTMYPAEELRQKYCPGVEFEDLPVVADSNIITGRGPGAALALAFHAAKALGCVEKAEKTAEDMLIPEASL